MKRECPFGKARSEQPVVRDRGFILMPLLAGSLAGQQGGQPRLLAGRQALDREDLDLQYCAMLRCPEVVRVCGCEHDLARRGDVDADSAASTQLNDRRR
ncbi:MAG: hypothetical protein IPG91_10710 [Ideonella sp.]|nr:hypothetical protein [Ideonella sp.]